MYMQDCFSMIELLITNKCKHFSFLGPININPMYKTGELFNTNEISYKKNNNIILQLVWGKENNLHPNSLGP